jgi:penicillin-binding protein 1C
MTKFLKILFKSKAVLSICALAVILLSMDVLFPVPKVNSYSKEIIAKDGTLLSAYLSDDDKWRLETTLDEISPNLIKSIIEKEDKWFAYHTGINPVSMIRALYNNIITGERTSGASTITMQVARMLEPKDRNYFNKILEVVRAVQIELHYSKKEILELYLNLLPYGGNIEGVKAASYIYFNHPPNQLSLSQVILLSVIPNDPNSLRLDRSVDFSVKERDNLIRKFIKDEIFTKSELKDALDEPVMLNRFPMPSLAPHFSYYIKNKYDGNRIVTTLDLKIQHTSENLLWNYVNRVISKGVSNGAVIILDNKTSSVIGYCGSSNFYDENSSGQVNGITAVRSPGSTLKPALYAYAFDRGILTPKMKLYDIPTNYDGYEPENYDLNYYGEITAGFALANSLNIPAVSLLKEVKIENFIQLLSQSGFDDIARRKNDFGLSIILGGCGVTLEEIAGLYSAFANEGVLRTIRYKPDEKVNESEVFSHSSTYLIADLLSGNSTDDFYKYLQGEGHPKFAWKTGTSYGKRDAWAVGFNKAFTIGVWLGNFNGQGSPHLSGAEMAVPLLYELFGAIDFSPEENWFEQPESILERKVCSESGLLPSPFCSDLTTDYYIEDVSHNKVCNIHKEIYTNSDFTIQYCTECLPSNGYKKKVYTIHNPQLNIWYLQHDIQFKKPPPHNRECQAMYTEQGPHIISPSVSYQYLVEENSQQEILLSAVSDGTVKTHYWFLNDNYFTKCEPGERIFFQPKQGELKITCMDDKGRDETISVKINYY